MNRPRYLPIVSALAVAVLATGALAIEDEAKTISICKKVVVVTDGSGDDDTGDKGEHQVICLTGTGDSGATRFVISGDGDDDGIATYVISGDGDEEGLISVQAAGHSPGCAAAWGAGNVALLAASATGADADRGWLGVQLGEVPPALTAQLGLDDKGVMIVNVVEDSPAAKAGLKNYDVVVAIAGEPVDGSIGAFAEKIGQAGPGATLELTVVGGGKERTVQVKLDSRPAQDEFIWQYALPFGPSISEKYRTHGKVLRIGPDGDVVINNLGDLKAIEELPDSIRALIPDVDDIVTNLWVETDAGRVTTRIKTRVEQDGQTIVIEQEGDDKITVSRTTTDSEGNSQTTEKVYDSPDELEEDDKEAFEVYAGIQGHHVIDLDLGGLAALGLPAIKLGDIRVDVEERSEEAQKSIQEAMKAYEAAMQNLKGRQLPHLQHYSPFPGSTFFGDTGRARHNISVDSDGHIEIRIRKGDAEVVLDFDSEDDLKKRKPGLYEKYLDLMEAPVED